MREPKIHIPFLNYVLKELGKEGYRLIIHPSKKTPNEEYGRLDEEERELHIALYNPIGFNEVLAHEFKHFLQFTREDSPFEGYGIFLDYLDYKEQEIKTYIDFLPIEIIEKSKNSVLLCEREAEEYAVQTAEKWKFPGFTKNRRIKYIQNANLYLFMLEAAFRIGIWQKMTTKEKNYFSKQLPKDRIVSIEEACRPPQFLLDWIEKTKNAKSDPPGK